jgi:hypothetical protein
MALANESGNHNTLANAAALTCLLSFGAYVLWSQVLHSTLAGLEYHLAVTKMFFAKHAPLLDHIPRWTDLAPLLAFILLCIVGGFVAALLVSKDGRTPYAITYAFVIALAPTLMLALWYWPDGRGHLTTGNILKVTLITDGVLALLLLVRSFGKRKGAEPSGAAPAAEPLPKAGGRGWAVALACVMALTLIAAALNGLVTPVQGYDSTAYHLPLAATFLRDSAFLTGLNPQLYYPANGELLQRWALTIGTDQLIAPLSWIMALVCGYALYAIATVLGQSRTAAAIAAMSLLALPLVINLSITGYTDLTTTALFLFAVLFLIKWWQSDGTSLADAVTFGAAAGLAIGSKYSAGPPTIVLAAMGAIALVMWPRHVNGRKAQLLLGGVLAAVAAFVCGGFWYLRNLALTGNPIYPIAMFGMKGMPLHQLTRGTPALSDSGWNWLTYPWTEIGYANPFDEGTGLVFAALALPAMVFYLWICRTRPNRKGSLLLYILTLALWAVFFRSGVILPRYALIPLVLSFVFVGELWEALVRKRLQAIVTTVAILAAVTVMEPMIVGTFYSSVRDLRNTVRYAVPKEVDGLPPTTIFNAAAQKYTYGLMGIDHRHNVVGTYFTATPEMVLEHHADYVLLLDSQVPEFTAKLSLKRIASYPPDGPAVVSLWKLEDKGVPSPGTPQ